MKNMYSDFIKYLMGQKDVRVQHDGSTYFVGDAYIAASVPCDDYVEYFVPASALFVEVDYGFGVNINFHDAKFEVTGSPMKYSGFFSPMDCVEIKDSGVSIDCFNDYTRKHEACRIFIQNGKGASGRQVVTAAAERFLKLFKKFPPCRTWTSSPGSPLVFYSKDYINGYIILPIHIGKYAPVLQAIAQNV